MKKIEWFSIPVTVRIQNTNTMNMGRVEVSMNGTWGKVAYSRGWTMQSANVVCRMLGLPNATAAPELSLVYYKRPSGFTWIQIDGCTGNETSLFDCKFRVLGRSSYYNQYGDPGVICGPPKGILIYGCAVLCWAGLLCMLSCSVFSCALHPICSAVPCRALMFWCAVQLCALLPCPFFSFA